MLLSESYKKRIKELSGIIQEQNGGTPRTLAHTSRRASKYRNPEGPAKYFAAYKRNPIVQSEDYDLMEINPDEVIIPEKYIHDDLNAKLWENGKLNEAVRRKLLKIAAEFYEYIKVNVPMEGVQFTGSMANYNWTKFSDIDLHILVDYSKIDKDQEFVREYLMGKKAIWNDRHKIKIFGHDVELYAQDTNEPHHSTGVYDLENDEWFIAPVKKEFEIDRQAVKEKALYLINDIEKMQEEQDAEKAYILGLNLKDKIRKMRQSGLETAGEFSIENLAFKYLRNNGYLGILSDSTRDAYDNMLSLKEKA